MYTVYLANDGGNITFNGEAVNSSNQATNTSTADASTQTATQSEVGALGGNSGIISMVLYIVAIVAIFYFFAFRPQVKKEKAMKEMQNSIKIGDSVMTTSGFYGKVVDSSDQVFVIEFGTNKGIRIPVSKNEIVGIKEPNLSTKATEESK